MREDFLHYIWKHNKIQNSDLKTTCNKDIIIKDRGQHNFNSGPDFFSAQLSIDGLLWAGNVEIHVKSSDWFVHNHEADKAYDNVILHVVWHYDTDIYRSDESKIPTLELKQFVDSSMLDNYHKLMNQKKAWINCESDFPEVEEFLIKNWIERLYIQRLERKAIEIKELLIATKNDWEVVLFKMLLRNFGLKVNKISFQSLANAIDFSVVRKVWKDNQDLEALLFGISGLLNEEHQDAYYLDLKEKYRYHKSKFNLDNNLVVQPQFFRLRPPNFPTIRLSQFANLYSKQHSLFSEIINMNDILQFYKLFNIGTSEYWQTHYTFSKTSKASKKILSKTFIDLLLINTIVPLKFTFQREQGQYNEDEIFNLIREIKPESNSIVDKFLSYRQFENSALISQGLLELKQNYCNKNYCLQCAIGSSLILKN